MKIRIYILCLFFVFSGSIYGQKKISKSGRYQAPSLLEQAEAVKEKSPTAAIKLLEEAVIDASKKKDWQMEGEAYILLANIYEQIGQKKLALQRYNQSLKILMRSKKSGPQADIYRRIGELNIDLKNDKEAEYNFRLCIKTSDHKELKLKCEEGLADVELLRGNIKASNSQLDFLENNYALDSVSTARLEARRSQAYVQQNDYPNASQAFYNSVNTLPKNKDINKEDYAPIEKAQESLLNFNEISNIEKLDLQNTYVTSNSLPENIFVRENLKIASLYEEENNWPEAEKFIAVSKMNINARTDAATAAAVYKKSSEINRNKGNVDAALADLEKYISAKEKAIENLENDLTQQIEIVKGQKDLDERKQLFNLEQKERELYESQLNTQKIIIGFLSLLLVASLIYFYYLFKNVKAKRKANQLLLLKSLRTQMNPHFIFNALNSVNNFIAKNDEKSANKFLSEFSRLMRKVLDYSQKDFISFEEEMELNELYLKLEHFRFRDKFNYVFENNVQHSDYDLEIPPMLIQPFIENAVWHGLRYKEDMGHLSIKVEEKEKELIVEIKDDGIGRKKSKELKTKNQKKLKSTGLENVSKRITLINEIYNKNYEINVTDVDENAEDTGTVVRIKIPVK